MQTFATPEPILAVVDMATAVVRINASDRTDTVVEVRPSDEFNDADVRAAENTQVAYEGGRLLVRTVQERDASGSGWGLSLDKLVGSPASWARSLLFGGGSVDVTIELPADSRVEAKTSGGLRCRGPLGEVRFTTSYGDIQIEEAGRLRLTTTHGDISITRSAGHAEVTTTNGEIRIGEIDGTAVIKTSHGDVRLGQVTGELRLHSAYGDSTVDRALAGVAARTAYGSVRIGEVRAGSVVLETTGGGLELGIREGTAAWLDVSSTYGTVDVSLDPSDGPGQTDQVVEVRAHTAYGDIVIHRS
ncbi:DUF4097 family beta strand repeat-containing protein [Sphaerisporangium fuscum]|uniref:DUF4097 family beta strand repeat-containing protein n=1 Tax=Sphaerisporangium fuscum TaxID=2835868 RepID=UPI001BDC9DCE|nr:DUF4097 family beta strand repeat-containing protein [Sphaerisporangium fuscum]